MNKWWAEDASERYWLEVTDRHDLGADLRAPTTDESGRENWRYSLFNLARVGDVVLHYHKTEQAQGIVGYSVVAGQSEQAEIVWAARGTYSRSKGTQPHARPGYRIPLSGFSLFSEPLLLSEIRARRDDIRAIAAAQEAITKPPLYFPFELSQKRDLRLLQGYAFKLPRRFVESFQVLEPALRAADGTLLGEMVSQQQSVKAERNPVWSRDELILALDLYIRHRTSPPGKGSAAVLELSEFLSVMGRALGVGDAATYRNANGVYMKMMNFRRFDPQYTDSGKVGLTRGNKDEQVVWAEFANDLPRLGSVVAAIRIAVTQHAEDDDLGGADEPEIQEAEEGRVLTRVHRVRERSRKLVEQCKKAALKKHGRLTCAACGFDFAAKYGPSGMGLIDVHHTKPVHTLAAGDKTSLADLVLLCANCHRVVHSTRRWLSVDQVRQLVSLSKQLGVRIH